MNAEERRPGLVVARVGAGIGLVVAALLTAAVAFGLGVPLARVLATVANEVSQPVLLLQGSGLLGTALAQGTIAAIGFSGDLGR